MSDQLVRLVIQVVLVKLVIRVHTAWSHCRHSREIEQIVYCAQKEQELESQFRSIEEEWNEQVDTHQPSIPSHHYSYQLLP